MNTKINYKEQKFISPEEVESQEVKFMVEDTKLQFQKDLLETKRALSAAQVELNDLKTDYPLNVQAIIDKQIEIENYEDAITRMNELGEELGFNNK